MKNIMKLALANIRKSKSQTFNILLIVLIAAMLLNVGLVLFSGVADFFDERAEELNAPHFISIQPANEPLYEQINFIENFDGTAQIELQNIIYGAGSVFMGDESLGGLLVISTPSAHQLMNPPSLIGEHLPLDGNAIYIPHFMFLSGGFAIGDEFLIEFMGEEMLFSIAGSTEEIMFGSDFNTVWRFYISNASFAELLAEFPDSESTMISARLTTDGRLLAQTYGIEFSAATLSFGAVQNNRTFISVMAASMMVTFALILLIVSIIVIRFRISNDIEEHMVNIGVLKSIGYRSKQIISSVVMQFGIIALVGAGIGVMLAQFLLPLAASVLEPQLGLVWNPSFDLLIMSITIALLLVLTLLFALVTSLRIKKLHPLVALRGDTASANHTKNPLPLDKTRTSLNFALAIKQLLKSKRQAIMVSIIIAAVTFVSVEGLLLNYNINVDNSSFMSLFGEIPDIFVFLDDPSEAEDFRQRAELMPDLKMIFGYENRRIMTEGELVLFTVVEDFSLLAGNDLISGRFPETAGEIAMDRMALSELGKEIGDSVTMQIGELAKDYTIVGIVQQMDAFIGMISYDGIKHIYPDFEFGFLFMYVAEGVDVDGFIESFSAANPHITAPLMNALSQFEGQMGAMGNIFGAVNIVILIVAAGVVIMVLYLIIKTIILRKRRELGIQKALGFTTLQLMNQIALSLTPSIVFGVTLGAVAGYALFNPVFITMSRSMGMGITQANMLTPISWVAAASLLLITLAYIVSMLVAWRIRKISAYALVSE
ncbi:MAG: ABC transporter permease [Defluviitaleaceae bacterium]|nr:ABC transporter permease [Defluviitaleaceae bacterium]